MQKNTLILVPEGLNIRKIKKEETPYQSYSEKADVDQSKLCIGINAEFDSWEKAVIANCILGGGAGSVLFK